MHLVGIIYYNIITMHGPMNIKFNGNFLPTFWDNYHYSLRNDPEDRSPQLLGGGILKLLVLALIASSFG